MHYNADLIVLDEPTVALAVAEVRKVLDFVRRIKASGRACIYIDHNLAHVHGVADRLVILDRGRGRRRGGAAGHVGGRADRISHRAAARGVTDGAGRAHSRLGRIEGLPIILVFALLLALFMYTAPQVFLQPFIYTTFLSTLPPLILLAVGLTFVIGAGEIDLCFPAIIAFSGFVFAVLFKEYDLGWIAVVAGLASGLLVGFLNGILVARSASRPSWRRWPPSSSGPAWRRCCRAASPTRCAAPRRARSGVDRRPALRRLRDRSGSRSCRSRRSGRRSIVVFLWFILNRHRFGDSVLFIGDSNAVSRVVGIDVEREKIKIFTLMGGARRASPRSC